MGSLAPYSFRFFPYPTVTVGSCIYRFILIRIDGWIYFISKLPASVGNYPEMTYKGRRSLMASSGSDDIETGRKGRLRRDNRQDQDQHHIVITQLDPMAVQRARLVHTRCSGEAYHVSLDLHSWNRTRIHTDRKRGHARRALGLSHHPGGHLVGSSRGPGTRGAGSLSRIPRFHGQSDYGTEPRRALSYAYPR